MGIDFYAVLDQVLTLLRSRGRVTYNALKLQFNLDDAHLTVLKEELLYAHPQVIDDEGRGLIWTGTTVSDPASSAAHTRVSPRTPLADMPRPSDENLLASPHVVHSAVMRLYVDLVSALLQREGWVSYRTLTQLFGFDEACLDHVRQELIFQQIARDAHGEGLEWTGSLPRVVVTDSRRAEPADTTVETASAPSDAVELLPVAPVHPAPEAERRQLTVLFCDLVGSTQLSGQLDPEDLRAVIRAYQEAAAEVIQHYEGHIAQYLGDGLLVYFGYPAAHEDDARRAVHTGLGIAQAIASLNTRLAQSEGGARHAVPLQVRLGIHTDPVVVGVMGGGGRHEHLALGETPNLAARLQALAPANAVVISAVTARLVHGTFHLEDLGTHALHGVAEPMAVSRVRGLLATPSRDEEFLTAAVPVLVAWEDLHWADPTTLEALGLVVEQAPTVPMLHVLTSRPEFNPPWPQRSHITPLVLNRLERPQVEALIAQRASYKSLPVEVVQHIVAKTDGVPLYVEELTKMLLASALLREEADQYVLTGPLRAVAIPDTLQDALMARLDQLQMAKEVAQLGAVLGREFAYELLQATAPQDDDTLQAGLAQLVGAELLYQRGRPPRARYLFKHALIQDAAYASWIKSTRQQVHQQIAQAFEARFPALAETQPELVAQHYTAAGCHAQAVHYWQRAGQQASERLAHLEAISHLTTGIELLTTLPETPEHTQQSLTLHIALGVALQTAKGFGASEVEHVYTQARALCQQVGETPQLVPVLYGLWRFYVGRSQLHTSRELGETLLRLAQRAHDPALAVITHYALGVTWFLLGALPAARQHLEEGSARYMPDQRRAPLFRMGHDPGVSCRHWTALTLWLLGYPNQALARVHDALTLAHELSHPSTLAYARFAAANVYQFRRDVLAVHEHAEAAVALSTDQGFPLWTAWGTSLRGWALAMQGQGEEGLGQVRQGIAACRATGTALLVSYFCTVLADVSDHLGHTQDGLQALAEAHTLVEQHEERWWEAEIHRLRGVLLLRQTTPQQAEAETWLRRALDVARRQEAKALELRAAMSLSRLWQQQGRLDDARALLAPIYSRFTEGFDTADLQEAKALLDELA